jgi:hemoglobin
MKSIYEELGGGEMLVNVIDKFYERVLIDPLLQLYFVDVDMSKKKDSFKKYVSTILGAPDQYHGSTLYQAHRGKQITDLGFDVFVELFISTLRDMKLREDLIAQISEKLLPLKNDVVDEFQWPGKHYYAPTEPQRR